MEKKEQLKKNYILNGNVWKVILSVSFPLIVYNLFLQLVSFFDSLMASEIGATAVSAISIVGQVNNITFAISTSLSIGGTIFISRFIGSGKSKKASEYSNQLFLISIIMSFLLLIIILPFSKNILKLLNTPDSILDISLEYYVTSMIYLPILFFNNAYIAIIKATANNKKILFLNLIVLTIKLILNYIFVYILRLGIIMLAVSTLLSQLIITFIAIREIKYDKIGIKINIFSTKLNAKILKNMARLSLPIFVEKGSFFAGKIMVNSIGTFYGELAAGALGISNTLSGIVTIMFSAIQDAESTLISQNIGNNNWNRAKEVMKKSLVYQIGLAILGILFYTFFMDKIIGLFAKGDLEFFELIKQIFRLEYLGFVTLAITDGVIGLFYGIGLTKITFVINFLRLFLFRLPVLLYIINFTNLGPVALGWAMLISNFCVGIVAVIVVLYYLKQIKMKKIDVYNQI
ncbi:MAG: MATE family efflux transporter [Miniphocaeibacter sp.]|uniref:MATE family efflux transporter n=1 Tax=Miniphocaeibacter sp. TaxID=3100973 RepID=UPI003BB1C48A